MARRRRAKVQVASPWVLHAFMFVPTAIGLALLVFSCSLLLRAHEAQTWPTVPGLIEKAGGRRTLPAYRYDFRGQTYRASRTFFGFGKSPRYGLGDAVTVHVNPENPGDAVLHPGWTWHGFAMPSFGILILFVTMGMWRVQLSIMSSLRGTKA